MKKTKIIVANWKMNILTEVEAKKLFSIVKRKTTKIKNVSVVFCSPFVYLPVLKNSISKKYLLGTQNISGEEKGSFTGEVSVLHIKQYKVSHCIVGHSERRKMGEDDKLINKKVRLCLLNKISPVLCVGEWTRDENGEYLEVVKNQIKNGLAGVSRGEVVNVLIAYEPVFAISPNPSMKPNDIYEMYLWIKKCLKEMFGDFSDNIKIIYGGDVNSLNSKEIFEIGNVDGVLVGKSSLDAEEFSTIIKNTQ